MQPAVYALRTLLLLTVASVICRMSKVAATAMDDNGYDALMSDTLQLQQHHQQQQQQQQPFDFANLRRLHLKYKSGPSYEDDERQTQGKGHQQQQNQQQTLQRQQQQQQRYQLQISHNEPRDQDNEDDNNDNINNSNSNYYNRYSMSSSNNNNNGNPNRNNVDKDKDDDYEHQDGRNGFRLQLSDSNEPFRSRSDINNSSDKKSPNHNNNENSSNSRGNKEEEVEFNSNSNNNRYVKHHNNDGYLTVASKNDKSYSDTLNDIFTTNDSKEMSFGEIQFDDDLEMNLPYGIQNVKRTPRRNMEHNGKITTYQSLCPTKRISIPLQTSAYEYRPNHYIEVTCAHNYMPTQNLADYNKNRICSEAGFACIQLNRTIHLIRRHRVSSIDCWESEIRIVPSGCECMWPKHHYGDIVTYHQEQKRQSNSVSFRPVSNVDLDLGHVEDNDYLEIPVEVIVDENGQERAKGQFIDADEFY